MVSHEDARGDSVSIRAPVECEGTFCRCIWHVKHKERADWLGKASPVCRGTLAIMPWIALGRRWCFMRE